LTAAGCFGGLTIYENLRLSLQARHPRRFDIWRDVDRSDLVTVAGDLVAPLRRKSDERVSIA
jgi:branched-chain amino acid transport system ATP-binding protein